MLLLRNKSRLRIHKSGCCASVRKHSYSDEESERKTHTATLVIRNTEPQGEGGPGTSKQGGRRAPWTNAGDPRASDVSAAAWQRWATTECLTRPGGGCHPAKLFPAA